MRKAFELVEQVGNVLAPYSLSHLPDAKNATEVVMDVTNIAFAASGRATTATCSVVRPGYSLRFNFHLSTTTKISVSQSSRPLYT